MRDNRLPSLDLLKSLVVFCESSNIVEASQKLGLSQPLLSKQLKMLESMFPAPLFEFRGRKKIVTPLGQALKETAERSLSQLEEELKSLEAESGGMRKIRIGARREILKGLFESLSFDGNLEFLPLRGSEIVRGLKSGTLEIAIAQLEIESSDLIRKKVFSDHVRIAWNKDLRLSKGQSASEILRELQSHRCFDYGESAQLREVCSFYGVPFPRKRTVLPDWNLIVEAISREKAWGCVPSHQLEGESLESISLDLKRWPAVQFHAYYSRRMARYSWFQEVVGQVVRSFV